MAYSYGGNAHRQLVTAYRADESPFPTCDTPEFPRRDHLRDEIDLLKKLIFPRCWNAGSLIDDEAATRDAISELGSNCCSGIRPYGADERTDTVEDPSETVRSVLDRLPEIRETVKKDVEAAYKGDPAAKSYLEVVRSYPGVHAALVYRFAHALYVAGAAAYARELSEYAKTETGIDIHPGADIGEHFFVDHGTGVVIGETATVGDWVRLYQNVTLGALHFEEQEGKEHMLKKGYKRHPDIGDHVVIGAGTNVLGTVTVGDHVSIGANSWITEDIPDHTKVFVAEHPKQIRKHQGEK